MLSPRPSWNALQQAARLDRLLGLRPPYPELPGGNRLDAKDRDAAAAAARILSAAVETADTVLRTHEIRTAS